MDPAPPIVCWKCGASLADLSLPFGRRDECRACRAELHVCRMCRFYDTRKAKRAIARFVSLHPHNLAQKAEVIVEHLLTHTRHKIGGKGKAMVVTSSRLHAVRYKLAIDKYLLDKGYVDTKALVAFSGTVDE